MNYELIITNKEIEEIRILLNYSKNKFANLLNIQSSSVSNWESGKTKPTIMHTAFLIKLKEKIKYYSVDIVKKRLTDILMEKGRLGLYNYIFSDIDFITLQQKGVLKCLIK